MRRGLTGCEGGGGGDQWRGSLAAAHAWLGSALLLAACTITLHSQSIDRYCAEQEDGILLFVHAVKLQALCRTSAHAVRTPANPLQDIPEAPQQRQDTNNSDSHLCLLRGAYGVHGAAVAGSCAELR